MIRYLIFILIFVASCGSPVRREYIQAKRLANDIKSGPVEWTAAIGKFENIVKMKVNARLQQAQLYSRLGDHFFAREMWKDALENYKLASEIRPSSASLWYKQGLCLSQLFRYSVNAEEKKYLLSQACDAYEKSLIAEPFYVPALYALGILEFEFNSNQERGIELMNLILKKEPHNISALFALGRFYYMTGEYEKSLECYKKLESVNLNKDQKEQVRININTVKSKIYEGG